jgi:hypothetical protein
VYFCFGLLLSFLAGTSESQIKQEDVGEGLKIRENMFDRKVNPDAKNEVS